MYYPKPPQKGHEAQIGPIGAYAYAALKNWTFQNKTGTFEEIGQKVQRWGGGHSSSKPACPDKRDKL